MIWTLELQRKLVQETLQGCLATCSHLQQILQLFGRTVGKSDGHKFYVHNTYPGFMDTDKLIGKLTKSMDPEESSAMRKSTIRRQGFSLPTSQPQRQ
jgi:hypothetical protein